MAYWWILIDNSFRIFFFFSGNEHRHLKDSLDVFKGMKLNWLMVCVNPDKIIYQPFDELKGISPLIVHKNHHTFWFIVLTVTLKNVEGRFENYDDYLFDAKRTIQCDAPFIPLAVQQFLLGNNKAHFDKNLILGKLSFSKCDIKIGQLLFEKHPKIFIRATNQIACSS